MRPGPGGEALLSDQVGFHGGFVRASLLPLEAPEVRIAADLSSGEADAPRLACGAELPIALPPDRLRVYPA